VGRQGEHRDAADHHAGERLRLLGGGERHLRGAEQRAHGVVHVEPRGSLHHARAELPRLLLRGDDDRVARAVERQPVFLAARRRVGEGGIDLHQLVRHTETIEDVDDSLFDHGRIRVMPWPASVKATVAPGASGVSTAELVTKSSPISDAIEYSMREPRYAACLTVPRSTPSVGAPPAIRITSGRMATPTAPSASPRCGRVRVSPPIVTRPVLSSRRCRTPLTRLASAMKPATHTSFAHS